MSLVTQINGVVTRIGTEFKTVYGKMGSPTNLTTTDKTNLVAGINEVNSTVAAHTTSIDSLSAGSATIDDATASTTTVYSSSKTDAQINSAVAATVDAAPAALDTLRELADALGGDANFASTVTTGLGNRLRFDAAQTLSAGQKTQGQTNLDVYSKAEVGDVATDFVATFNTAIV